MPNVICDTSPLKYLHQSGLLYLLQELYGHVIVPQAVKEEFNVGRDVYNLNRPDLEETPWVSIRAPTRRIKPALLPLFNQLGRGEKQVISIGLATQDALLILDDMHARRCASKVEIAVTGTAGVLIAAKNMGLLASIRPPLDDMINNGFYLSKNTYQECLDLAGEENTFGVKNG